jgi:alpha-galactosidase
MSPDPRLPDHPVYGSNDWYYAYGNNTAKQILEDAHRIVSLSPGGNNSPYAVVDAGWQPYKPADSCEGGEWDRGNDAFPDMPALANDIHKAGAHPGIWIRPLQAPANAPAAWRMVKDHEHLDPTVPETLHKVHEDIARLRSWGFDLIKHDFSTFDIFRRWGFQMGASVTGDGWSFAEGSGRTSAEVILDLYRTIREAAGNSLVIGCNTVSHLSAGLFEICRIGDDTSGQEWARTRKMGVNCLAFRSVQNGSFYIADPDCVGVTKDVPWEYNKQWLDLLSRSGTMTFVSLNPNALGSEQERDLRNAFAMAAHPQQVGEALDWQDTLLPNKWLLIGKKKRYDWIEKDGVSPF